jgi:hypothetical protein
MSDRAEFAGHAHPDFNKQPFRSDAVEGGSTRSPRKGARLPHLGNTSKSARDTALACCERAAADLERALMADTANGRLRFESSARSWSERGALLARLEASFAARQAPAKAAAPWTCSS